MLSEQGDTPLIMAIKRGMTDVVTLLLEHGAYMNRKDQVNAMRLIKLSPLSKT